MVRYKRKDEQYCQQQHELAGGNDAAATETSIAAATTTKYARQHEGGTATSFSNATTGTAKTSESHELGDRKREGTPNATVVVRKRRQPATNSGKLVATESEVTRSAKLTVDAIQSTTVSASDILAAALSETVRPSTQQCSTKREDDAFWPA